jgi:predicted NUDIX family NTP pyrophosphohydrolase
MPKRSAGLLMFRPAGGAIEVLLVHPGGPFWAKKDAGAWSIPKGEIAPGEEPLDAAQREFEEETSFTPKGPYLPLGDVRQKSGKIVAAWAFQGTCDPAKLRSNSFSMEWPPRSGEQQTFPEIDRGAFFEISAAREKMSPVDAEFLSRLEALQAGRPIVGVAHATTAPRRRKSRG